MECELDSGRQVWTAAPAPFHYAACNRRRMCLAEMSGDISGKDVVLMAAHVAPKSLYLLSINGALTDVTVSHDVGGSNTPPCHHGCRLLNLLLAWSTRCPSFPETFLKCGLR